MRGKSVTLWLFVFGLSLAAASPWVSFFSGEDSGELWEDSGEGWKDLPAQKPTTTTEPPRTMPKTTTTSTTTTTTTTTERTAATAAPKGSTTTTATTTTTERAPAAGRAADYEYYEDAGGSLKLHPAAPWREARRVCLGEGAELASPETAGLRAAMSTALLSSPQSPEQLYTGINDLYSKGLFSSLRGTPLSDMPLRWAAGAPSGTPAGACLALRRDGQLSDAACDAELPYLCYKRQAAGPETECGTNPEYKYNEDTESCYKIHESGAAWKEAYARCRREGAQLLVLGGRREALAARGLARAAGLARLHVGATRWEDGGWMTVHGETLQQAGFAKWDSEESSDPGACAGLVSAGGVLAQHACSLELPFICEKKAYL